MEDRDLTELQDGAYKNMLEALATAEDPDAAQKLANAVAQLEKGRNEIAKTALEHKLNTQKCENECEMSAKAEKREVRKAIFDGVIKTGTLLASIGIAVATFKAEETSYIGKPKLFQQGLDLLRRNK